MSSECFQGMSYDPCDDASKEECGGKANAEYVYALQTSSSKGITQQLIIDNSPTRDTVYTAIEPKQMLRKSD